MGCQNRGPQNWRLFLWLGVLLGQIDGPDQVNQDSKPIDFSTRTTKKHTSQQHHQPNARTRRGEVAPRTSGATEAWSKAPALPVGLTSARISRGGSWAGGAPTASCLRPRVPVDGRNPFRTTLKPSETTVGWYLHGNQQARVS